MKRKLIAALMILTLLISLSGTLSFAAAAPAPATPTGIKAVALNTYSIRITWNATKGATGYELYSLSQGKPKFLAKIKSTSYTDSKLIKAAHSYSYQVRACVVSKGKTSYSKFTKVVTAVTPLNAPVLLTAEDMSSKSIQLNWQAMPEASGYSIYRSLSETKGFTKIATTATAEYLDQTCNGNTKYYYKLQAFATINGKKINSDGYSLIVNAQTIPNGKKYFTILFIGNSLTHYPHTNDQLDALCNEMGRYVKVHNAIILGSHLKDFVPIFAGDEYKSDKENADVVVFQEYGGGHERKTADYVTQIMSGFKHAQFYFMPVSAYKSTLDHEKDQLMTNVSNLTNLKTYALSTTLFEKYDDTLFRYENDFHPNYLYGYASAVLIYSTLFGTDPTTLPDDFLSATNIPAEVQANREAFFNYVRQAVKDALALE